MKELFAPTPCKAFRRDEVDEDVGRGPLVQQCHIRQAAFQRG